MAQSANPARFVLNGANPVLDLVNTLDNRYRADGPVELLGNYADLLGFMQQTKLLSARRAAILGGAANHGPASREAASKVLKMVRDLREAAAAALYAAVDGRVAPPAAIHALQDHCLDAGRRRQLIWKRPAQRSVTPPRASWVWGHAERELALPAWILAQAACELITSAGLDRLRACGNETCRWLFLDTSKNHTRRWCDMKICGNRVKARRFLARRRKDGDFPGTSRQPR